MCRTQEHEVANCNQSVPRPRQSSSSQKKKPTVLVGISTPRSAKGKQMMSVKVINRLSKQFVLYFLLVISPNADTMQQARHGRTPAARRQNVQIAQLVMSIT